MLVYLVNILLIIVWALVFCTGRRTKLKKYLFVGICFLQLYLIMAFRYRVGGDYMMYAYGFADMRSDGFSTLVYKDWEIGYIVLNKLVGLITPSFTVLKMITSFMILIGPAYMIAKYSCNAFISVFLYVNLYLFYMDMNFTRQAIAMSLMCFAYGFLKNKKFWRFLLIVAVAALFHLTVIYMIPVFLVCLLKVNTRTLLLYLFGLLFYYILSDGLLNIVLSKVHTEYSGSIFIENGVFLRHSLLPLLICAVMVFISYYVKNLTPTMQTLIHLTLMMGFWQIVMTKHALFERFSYYTMVFVVLAVPEAIKAFSGQLRENLERKYTQRHGSSGEDKSRVVGSKVSSVVGKTVTAVTAVVLVSAFAYNMIVGLIIPENGVHSVLPYQTSLGFDIPSIDFLFKSGNSV